MRLLFTMALTTLCTTAIAQNNNNNNNNNNAAGIIIDAEGVIQSIEKLAASPRAQQRLLKQSAEEALPAELIVPSTQRVLSLKKLETAVLTAIDAGEPIPEAVQYLAGIYRLDEIAFQQDDVLIAGPAEPFGVDAAGRRLCVEAGRPPLNLDDLLIALRATVAGERSIGCSIDPTEENLAKLQQYIRLNSTPTSSAGAAQRYRTMGQVLGMQEISVWGVPEDSHFALALVAADLRMKRISLGVEPAGVRGIRSHLSMLAPQGNSLQRWWFMPLYDPLQVNADRTLFRISGQRAQLMAQEEISNAQGKRTDAANTRLSTERFAELFTQHFQELADRSPVFAELQNLYDMAVLASLVNREYLRGNPAWQMTGLLSHPSLPVQKYRAPKSVPSASTFRKTSGGLIGLIGGVTVDVDPVVRNTNHIDEQPKWETPTRADSFWWNSEQ